MPSIFKRMMKESICGGDCHHEQESFDLSAERSLLLAPSFGGITLLHAIKNGVDLKHISFIATPSISEDIVSQFEQRINASPATGEYFQKKVEKKFGVTFKSISASEAIKEIDLSSLYLVHDEQDKDVSIEHAKLMKENYPEAKTYFTTGLGHTRILRDETVVNELIKRIDQFRN